MASVCRAAIFCCDRLLRRAQGIVPYSHTARDLLRIAVRTWEGPTTLIEGALVTRGDRIIELHLWNERIVRLGPFGTGLGWGARLRGHVEQSFVLLAARAQTDHALADCVAIRAEIVFPDRRTATKFARIARHFGLAYAPWTGNPGLGRCLLALALIWASNPRSLAGKRICPGRAVFWVSMAAFKRRYAGAPTAPAFPVSARQGHETLR